MRIAFVIEDTARGVKVSTGVEHNGVNDGIGRSIAFDAGLNIEGYLRMLQKAGALNVVEICSALPLLPAPRR